MTRLDYPFEEFAKDFKMFIEIQGLERKAFRGVWGSLPEPIPFESLVIQVFEFMRTRDPDDDRVMNRARTFTLILQYLIEHIEDFDTADYAVVGSRESGALVSTHLLKALHEFFNVEDLSGLRMGPTPMDVLQLAERYRDKD